MTTISTAYSASAYSSASNSGIQDYANVQMDRTPPVDNDDDADRKTAHVRHHRGGHMHDAIRQTLDSLGLSRSDTKGTGGTTNSKGDQTKQDMHDFMHALFQAIKNDTPSAANTASNNANSGKTDAGAGIGTGLNALLTDVSNGKAPTDLQDAFSRLVADFQNPSNNTGSTSGDQAAPTLQTFLTQLQAKLGYGTSTSGAAGSLVNAIA